MTKLKSHLLWIRCNVFLKQTLDYRLNGKYLMDIFTEWLYYQPFVNRITKYLQRLQGRIYFLFHGEKSFMRVWGLAEVWAKESNVLQGIRVQNTVRISWLTKAFKDFFKDFEPIFSRIRCPYMCTSWHPDTLYDISTRHALV